MSRSLRGLIPASVPRSSTEPVSWSDVARLCRRICLLRERSQLDDAEKLRLGTLKETIAAVRTKNQSDEWIEQKLEVIFAAETERVANAVVLADLIAPLLAGPAQSAQTVATQAEPAADAPVSVPESIPATPRPLADPGDIASFIDEMIAQERRPPRTPAVRRTS